MTITFLQWTIVGLGYRRWFRATTALLVFRFAVGGGGRRDAEALARPETAAFIANERRQLGLMPLTEKRAIAWFPIMIVSRFRPDFSRYFVWAENTFADVAAQPALERAGAAGADRDVSDAGARPTAIRRGAPR